jgi:hypothetical protein
MKRYDWVMDKLNTHWSLDVCRLVARWCQVPFEPEKLKNGVQRRAFLCDPRHRHVLHFTPKHGSWLHQAELFFRVLHRRFLARGSFPSAKAVSDCVKMLANRRLENVGAKGGQGDTGSVLSIPVPPCGE